MDIENQYKIWLEEKKTVEPITTEQLKEKVLKELTYVSHMDIREYTLYQKWCEIHRKYPTIKTDTLLGEQIQLEDLLEETLIKELKSNIWIPNDVEDYSKLEPELKFCNSTGRQWNTLRNFTCTMKNNNNIGRNLYFIVEDRVTSKYLGLICISSDFLDLTPRDNWIGWSRKIKTQGHMINHSAIGSTIVPFQPLGYNYVGGKLLALLCLSDEIQKLWKEKYGDVLVSVTTTSLYGDKKSNGLSQYDGLDYWNKMGFTEGSISYETSKDTEYLIRDWLQINYPYKYFEWYVATKPNGQVYKRDHRNRSFIFTYSKLGIPKELIKSSHRRGIYYAPLYDNTREFLRKEIGESELKKSFDTSIQTLTNIWKTKHAKGRIEYLKKKNKVSTETLFYDDLIYMSWEETKEKYLKQVGR